MDYMPGLCETGSCLTHNEQYSTNIKAKKAGATMLLMNGVERAESSGGSFEWRAASTHWIERVTFPLPRLYSWIFASGRAGGIIASQYEKLTKLFPHSAQWPYILVFCSPLGVASPKHCGETVKCTSWQLDLWRATSDKSLTSIIFVA